MRRIGRLLERAQACRGGESGVTLRFADGTQRKAAFLEAVLLCAGPGKVTDAAAQDPTAASLLRAILDSSENGPDDFGPFGE